MILSNVPNLHYSIMAGVHDFLKLFIPSSVHIHISIYNQQIALLVTIKMKILNSISNAIVVYSSGGELRLNSTFHRLRESSILRIIRTIFNFQSEYIFESLKNWLKAWNCEIYPWRYKLKLYTDVTFRHDVSHESALYPVWDYIDTAYMYRIICRLNPFQYRIALRFWEKKKKLNFQNSAELYIRIISSTAGRS